MKKALRILLIIVTEAIILPLRLIYWLLVLPILVLVNKIRYELSWKEVGEAALLGLQVGMKMNRNYIQYGTTRPNGECTLDDFIDDED